VELAKDLGDDVLAWTDAEADLVGRLMVPEAVPALVARARSAELGERQRRVAMDALAFIEDEAAAEGMIEVASLDGDILKDSATWWLINRVNGPWGGFDLRPRLRATGILPKGDEELVSIVIPNSAEATKRLPPVEEILALSGDGARGAELMATRCVMCHEIDGQGVQFGPVLTGWGRTQPSEVIARSILMPEADIAHGFDGHEVVTKDGVTIQGILISEGDPVQIVSMGGKVQMIPATRIAAKKKLEGRSLMLSADQLALTAQDVADIVSHMRQ
jgi:putative heme-binding domain-containing protein